MAFSAFPAGLGFPVSDQKERKIIFFDRGARQGDILSEELVPEDRKYLLLNAFIYISFTAS